MGNMVTGVAVEAKRDRFVRIAERRVNRVLDCLDSLGNCANRRNYEYSESDAKRIFDAIEQKVRETRGAFVVAGKERRRFKLG